MYSSLEPLRQFWDNVCTSIIVILMHRIYDNFTTISPQNRRKLSKKTHRKTKKHTGYEFTSLAMLWRRYNTSTITNTAEKPKFSKTGTRKFIPLFSNPFLRELRVKNQNSDNFIEKLWQFYTKAVVLIFFGGLTSEISQIFEMGGQRSRCPPIFAGLDPRALSSRYTFRESKCVPAA